MRLIVAGSRTVFDYNVVAQAIEASGWTDSVTEIVSGGALGADALGEQWATRHKVKIRRFPAYWKKHGKAAGPIRNAEMAAHADALVAVWDGESRGTKDMIAKMENAGKSVFVALVGGGVR